jgi:SAM-dependent methyltransferase
VTRYYHAEHEAAYQRLAREGLAQWNDLFGESWTFDNFPNREFLERVIPQLPSAADVLEYGCGTGTAACFLAARGFRVDAIDLIPEAIDLARRFAEERGVEVRFDVQDVCTMPAATKQYDVVLDSYCLQSIVMDADRSAVLTAVRDRLKPGGRYVLSTAMYDPDRVYEDDFRYDADSGICYQRTTQPGPDAVRIDNSWYLPHRRHLRPDALRAELEAAGLTITQQDVGNVVAQLGDATRRVGGSR